MTTTQKQNLIERIACGETVTKARTLLGVSQNQLRACLLSDVDFKADYEQAVQDGLEVLADSLLDVAESCADVQRAKIKADNLRYILSKRRPTVYGDRVSLDITGNVDLSAALALAEQRVNFMPSYPTSAAIVQDAETKELIDTSASDDTSLDDILS